MPTTHSTASEAPASAALTDRLDLFTLSVRSWMDTATAKVASLRDKLDADPAEALEWSLDAFEAAGVVRVGRILLHRIERGATIDELRTLATREALQDARYGARSTSPAADLMQQCRMSAWARFALELGGGK